MPIIEINSSKHFNELIQDNGETKHNRKFIFVDFYATWCSPCKNIYPELLKLSNKQTHVLFIKVDVSEQEELTDKYKVNSLPTFMIFNVGCMDVNIPPIIGANYNLIKQALQKLIE